MLSGNVIGEVLRSSPTMVVLLLCSVVVITFAIERWWFFRRTSSSAAVFKDTMRKYLPKNNLAGFGQYCQKDRGSLARVIGVALENVGSPRDEVDTLLDIELEKEQVLLERNLVILGTLANIAPLLGLFGTVVGIIRAFRDIAITGSGGSSVIAMGVSEALLTTAAGIVVAVIATIFFNAFTRKIRVRTTEVEEARSYYWKYLGGAQG